MHIYLKRSMDILISACALIVTFPLILVASLYIVAVDGRPILYRTKRAGELLQPIFIHKLRTMKNREKQGSRITAANDNRFFVGARFLRKAKLDELPQFFDVFLGRLSLIGPRPEDYDLAVEHFKGHPAYEEMLSIRPGLSSPGTLFYYANLEDQIVSGGDAEKSYLSYELPIKSAFDLVYVRNRSVHYDVSIIFRTVMLILQRFFRMRADVPFPEMEVARKIAIDEFGVRLDGE